MHLKESLLIQDNYLRNYLQSARGQQETGLNPEVLSI
jgi:hypothetical protein